MDRRDRDMNMGVIYLIWCSFSPLFLNRESSPILSTSSPSSSSSSSSFSLSPSLLIAASMSSDVGCFMEGLAVDPVSWPWTFPNLLIDTQFEFNHVLGESIHEFSSPPTCCQSWVLLHSIMSTYRQRFPSVIQQTLRLLYSGGFDCACSQSSRTFFFFFDYSHLQSRLNSILVILLPTWFHIRSWSVWLLLHLPYCPCHWLPIMLFCSSRLNPTLPRCVVLVMNMLRTAFRRTLICSPHASQRRVAYILADSCLTHYWTNSTQRTEWRKGKSHAPQILFVFHSYLARSWAPTTTGLTMQHWEDRNCRQEPLSILVPRQANPFPRTLGLLEWAISILPSWLMTAIVLGWHHTKCKTEGDESPQWHDSGWQRAVTLRGWIVEFSHRFARLVISTSASIAS